MAYSDYGGYAFKNGERVEERSDVQISPEGLNSTPGAWPGWSHGVDAPSYHVVLGSGAIFVGLYKQTGCSIYRNGEKLFSVCTDGLSDSHFTCWVGEVLIEVFMERTDNFYQYVSVEEPDGTKWRGFSGYGVGAGLEDAGYDFDTNKCVERLKELFPEEEGSE